MNTQKQKRLNKKGKPEKKEIDCIEVEKTECTEVEKAEKKERLNRIRKDGIELEKMEQNQKILSISSKD